MAPGEQGSFSLHSAGLVAGLPRLNCVKFRTIGPWTHYTGPKEAEKGEEVGLLPP